LAIVFTFEANCSSSDCSGREVVAEAFDCERGDIFIVLEGRSVMEDVAICAGVMVAVVVSGEGWVKYREGCLGNALIIGEYGVPSVDVGCKA